MACSKRGDSAACNYSNGVDSSRVKSNKSSRASEAQLRLQKLEQMVTGLMQTTQGRSGYRTEGTLHDEAIDQRLEDLSIKKSLHAPDASLGGHLDVNGSESSYLGATHWATILENVGLRPKVIPLSSNRPPLDS